MSGMEVANDAKYHTSQYLWRFRKMTKFGGAYYGGV